MASVVSKIFAITGGASGIGAATSRLLAHRGAGTLCIGDISSKNLSDLKKSLKDSNPSTTVHCTCLDVTSSSSVDEWIQEIISTFGDLHGAANIAGIPQASGVRQAPHIVEETDKMWSDIMGVNLDGVFYSTRSEVRAMKDLKPADRAIVNVSSIAALWHVPDVYAYGVSKGACAYFTSCVAKDTSSFGIRINAVSPGLTMTPMLPKFMPNAKTEESLRNAWKDDGLTVIEPEDVARTIVWLLSEDSRPVFGANINVGAGIP